MAKLNLGAGHERQRGFINHDIQKHSPHIDVAHDLDILPWPWPDESFEVVRAWAVFEHLKLTLAESIQECWRILKPGGTLVVKVPHFGAPTVPDDPTHRWMGWTVETFNFFDSTRGRYGQRGAMYGLPPWRILSAQVIINGHAIAVTMRKVGQ